MVPTVRKKNTCHTHTSYYTRGTEKRIPESLFSTVVAYIVKDFLYSDRKMATDGKILEKRLGVQVVGTSGSIQKALLFYKW